MNSKVGLVLEGGGFRGIYGAGILDFFLEKEIVIPYVIGVSMGACNGVNYISKQMGRSLKVPYTYLNDKRYMSYRSLFNKGQLFGMDFVFDEIPNKLIPFDFKTFNHSKQKFVVVATDCFTGEPIYIDDFSDHDLLLSLRASASLPFASKMVSFQNKLLYDGGISDPIPIEKAIKDGCEKLVIVLTQPKDYRKKPSRFGLVGKLMYKQYPNLINSLNDRYKTYNDTITKIELLEEQGKAFVIRPENKLPIRRTEKDREKLKEAFEIGYNQCDELIDELQDFLRM